MKTLIYGNGSIARLIHSFLKPTQEVVGFVVDDHCISDDQQLLCDLPLIPYSRMEQEFSPDQYQCIVAVGFVGMNRIREEKSAAIKAKGYTLASYVHDSVIIHEGVEIGEGCIILDLVSLHPGCVIGNGCFISSNVNIGHDCKVGGYCWINSGVAIAGGTQVGTAAFLGINASIANDIAVGNRNFIGANTFVAKNTENDAVYLSEQGQLFPMSSEAFLGFSGLE